MNNAAERCRGELLIVQIRDGTMSDVRKNKLAKNNNNNNEELSARFVVRVCVFFTCWFVGARLCGVFVSRACVRERLVCQQGDDNLISISFPAFAIPFESKLLCRRS